MSRKRQWPMNDSDARCPFFKANYGQKIVCESPIPGSTIHIEFDLKHDKYINYTIFCCGKYENCEIYRMMMGEYDNDDDG